jgi:hypothetical protein
MSSDDIVNHRVDTCRDVTGRRKRCGNLRFHVPTFFSGDRVKKINKNYQLRVLGKFRERLKRTAIKWDACMHLVTCRALDITFVILTFGNT